MRKEISMDEKERAHLCEGEREIEVKMEKERKILCKH